MGIVELFWRPGDVLQAAGRINRMGQTKTARINFLTAAGTIEERICEMLQEKQQNISAVLDGGGAEPELDIYSMYLQEIQHRIAA